MDEMEELLEKVMAPLNEDERPAARADEGGAVEAAPEAAADPAYREGVMQRYSEALYALYEDASKHQRVEIFVDAATLALAAIAIHFGPRVTGDVMRKLGNHLIEREQAAMAEREAGKEGGSGNLLH